MVAVLAEVQPVAVSTHGAQKVCTDFAPRFQACARGAAKATIARATTAQRRSHMTAMATFLKRNGDANGDNKEINSNAKSETRTEYIAK